MIYSVERCTAIEETKFWQLTFVWYLHEPTHSSKGPFQRCGTSNRQTGNTVRGLISSYNVGFPAGRRIPAVLTECSGRKPVGNCKAGMKRHYSYSISIVHDVTMACLNSDPCNLEDKRFLAEVRKCANMFRQCLMGQLSAGSNWQVFIECITK